jgi:hypothetical protein
MWITPHHDHERCDAQKIIVYVYRNKPLLSLFADHEESEENLAVVLLLIHARCFSTLCISGTSISMSFHSGWLSTPGFSSLQIMSLLCWASRQHQAPSQFPVSTSNNQDGVAG